MKRLLARLFGPTVKTVFWNIAFCLRTVPVAIYGWESSCIRG